MVCSYKLIDLIYCQIHLSHFCAGPEANIKEPHSTLGNKGTNKNQHARQNTHVEDSKELQEKNVYFNSSLVHINKWP